MVYDCSLAAGPFSVNEPVYLRDRSRLVVKDCEESKRTPLSPVVVIVAKVKADRSAEM